MIWKEFFFVSEHKGGAGVGAGRAEQHQKGQVYASGQSRWAEKQHEDGSVAEPAAQTGPETDSSEEGKTPLLTCGCWIIQRNCLIKTLCNNLLEQQRMELKSEGNPSNPVTPVKIPDCPVPASLLDELLKPSTSVNKEPLNNLHNCLRQLKYIIWSTDKL